MKTTNSVRIMGRILLQAGLLIMLIHLFIGIALKMIEPEASINDCIVVMSNDYITKAIFVIGISILLFGCWFHFVSQHRFMNRRPKGLYKEYITWFLREE
jgi:hypothetical protein